MTTAAKLDLIVNTKEQIRQKLNLPTALPFAEYNKYAYPYSSSMLFSGGKQGVAYEFNDLSTLFQDVHGRTPVTKDGDPVGLILDKSQGLELSTELVVNGNFVTNVSSWIANKEGVVLSWDESGKARVDFTNLGDSGITQIITQPEGICEITMVVTSQFTGAVGMSASLPGSTTGDVPFAFGQQKTLRFLCYRAAAGSAQLLIRTASGTPTGYFTVDNISVKKLKGGHAIQSVSAARPIYQTGDSRGIVNLVLNSESSTGTSWGGGREIVHVTTEILPPPELQSVSKVTATVGGTGISSQVIPVIAGKSYTWSVWIALPLNSQNVALRGWTPDGTIYVPTTIPVDGKFYRIQTTYNCLTSGTAEFGVSDVPAWLEIKHIYYGGLQVEEGKVMTEYQRNGNHLGGTGTGKVDDTHWLKFDGVDDFLQADVDFSASDAITIVAPVTKNNTDACVIVEYGIVNVGTFLLGLGGFSSGQDILQFNSYSTNGIVRSGQNLKGKSLWFGRANTFGSKQLRKDGALIAESQWATNGPLTKQLLYIGARSGTSAFFNGDMHGLTIVDKYVSDEVIEQVENHFSQKTGITLLAYTPRELFLLGQQGTWLDPSDLSTLFQDSIGTLPVTTDGDPVGLVLDKSQGLARNIVINVVGTAIPTSAYGVTSIKNGLNLTGQYKVELSIPGLARGTTAEIRFRYWQNNGVDEYGPMVTITGGEKKTINITFNTCTEVQVQIFYNNTLGTLDTQIYDIKGNHAKQTVSAARPIYQTGDNRGVVNLLLWSEDFSKSVWDTSYGILLTHNAAMSPIGTLTATKLIANTTSGRHYIQQRPASIANEAISVYAKAGEYKGLIVSLSNNPWFDNELHVDLLTGSIITQGAKVVTASITSVGDGWYRVSATFVAMADYKVNFTVTNGGNEIITGDNVSGIYIWGAQLENSLTVAAYQPNGSHLGGIGTGKASDLHWLYFDGVDDGLEAYIPDISDSSHWCLAQESLTSGCLLSRYTSNKQRNFMITEKYVSTARYRTLAYNGTFQGVQLESNQRAVVTSTFAQGGNVVNLKVNGEVATEIGTQGTNTRAINVLFIGSMSGFNGYSSMRLYSLLAVEGINKYIPRLEAYSSKKLGIAL